MPFDPAKPQPGDDLDADLVRDQLTALADRIAALEAALADTARNPSPSPLSPSLDDPPTRDQVQGIVNAFNALLNQLVRV